MLNIFWNSYESDFRTLCTFIANANSMVLNLFLDASHTYFKIVFVIDLA